MGYTEAWRWPVLAKDVPMPFGYGLSYTTFSISAPEASSTNISSGDAAFEISTTVENTGSMDGQEVVQVYFRPEYSTIETPVKNLIRFSKVALAMGESKELKFVIPQKELGYYVDAEWAVEAGNYTFWVGSSARWEDQQIVNVTIAEYFCSHL